MGKRMCVILWEGGGGGGGGGGGEREGGRESGWTKKNREIERERDSDVDQ